MQPDPLIFSVSAHRQQGAALAVSLIMLLVMTIIGVVSMDTARFENIMARNAQFQTSALSDAELVLRTGENDVDTIVGDGTPLVFDATGDHYYDPMLGVDPDPSLHTWPFTYGAAADGSYIIEYGGEQPIPGESSEMGASTAGSFIYIFMVSAQGETSKGAKRNVQTVYVTNEAP